MLSASRTRVWRGVVSTGEGEAPGTKRARAGAAQFILGLLGTALTWARAAARTSAAAASPATAASPAAAAAAAAKAPDPRADGGSREVNL